MDKFYTKPKFFIPTFIIALLAIVFAIQLSGTSSPILNGFSKAQSILPIPTLVPLKEATFKSEVHSADGTMNIILDKRVKPQTLGNYTITISKITGAEPRIILSQDIIESQTLELPPNSWSPDNKYIFFRQTDKEKLSFYVYKASGELFANGRDHLDIVPLFESKKYEFKLSDITGWDSNTLLHIFTQKTDGSNGPSFWFDVTNNSFYQLGSR